ncbi:TIGR03747 family integrating conjugative element membrane protein [Photorhabdus heterorhabditis]|uniref:TIGR03747 family integrating conjugative element membrane protein n=1 Tax=Photorhabdus heterorhabditis TaxID=880156 RepID=UPI001562E93F|nr:TIGR03747 family integrating conjugative element membrane protein [Photorhabdus heterorhabditis]NRN30706.1 TIGR03747 family integrating conjugative element membrane protein [Photorhabdus heterorhabditis subsp. aluminescens]
MAQGKTESPQTPPKKSGPLKTVLWDFPWMLIGLLLASLFFSLVIEYFGIAFFWPEQGERHSQQVMIMESGWLSKEFTRSLLLSEPPTTLNIWLKWGYQWVLVDSGTLDWVNQQHTVQARSHHEMVRELSDWRVWLAESLRKYLLATVYVTVTFIIRLTILVLFLPLFVMVIGVAVVEGLSRRDLRRYGAAYESSFVYHHAKRFVKPAFCVPCLLYLSWPSAVYPNLLLLPAALLLGFSITVMMSTFKKYL